MKAVVMETTDDNVSQTGDDQVISLKIFVPDLGLQKCMNFHREELIWDVKQQIILSLQKELKESFNYGLFCPPVNGKAGKFLDEERLLGDYPFPETLGFVELRLKKRVYKMMNVEEKQIKQLHTRANLRRMLEHISNNNVEKVSKLCARGMDPNFHCLESGETPLTIATSLVHPSKLIMTLVNGGALLDFRTKDGRTALHRAVEHDNYEALKTLLDLGSSPNYKDSRNLSPLYYTVLYGCNAKLTELLLHDHAIIGAMDPQGWQEVHQACKHGLVQHLEHLLFYGADMNAHNASGNTALHVCAVNDQESCARVLLFRGADKNSLNYANQNPYQVAVIAGNLNLAEMIQNHRPEDVVPYREAPKYNPRRRASMATASFLNRTHSDPRMEITLGMKPPSPCPSNRSLPPFSSVSTISEASTGSSTCTQPSGEDSEDTASASVITDKSMTSDSSGVCTSNSGTSYESGCEPLDTMGATIITPGAICVCVDDYPAPLAGHLHLTRGDLVEVTTISETGMCEGRMRDGDEGLFPASCVQEVKLRNTETLPIRSRVEGRREMTARQVSTVPRRCKIIDCKYGDPRTVILHKGKKGFGFVLRGAKDRSSTISATSPLMERQPTECWPSLQYLDDVDKGGVADMAGLKKGDFLLEINGQDVSQASHEHVVTIIRQSGDLVAMTVVTVQQSQQNDRSILPRRQCATLPRKLSTKKAPAPPKRDPKTTLSVGRARARSMVAGLAEIVLDRTLNEYDSEGRSTKSSSIESIPNKQGNMVTDANGQKIASIRSRPSSRRITTTELEDFFSRQRHEGGLTYGTLPAHLARKMPKVYGSVAAMKRCRGLRGKILDLSGKLHKDFHSSPDLNAEIMQSIPRLDEQVRRRSHSQEDISAMNHRNAQHSWGCPPHMYRKTNGTMAREWFSDYKDAWKSVEEIYERVKANQDGSEGTRREPHSLIYAETLPLHKGGVGKGGSRSSCPPPSHPPPPPPIGQVVKVDISRSMGEYANIHIMRQNKMKVMSSFRPGDNAKLYESPDMLKGVGFKRDQADAHHRRVGSGGSNLRSQSLPPRMTNNKPCQSGTSSEAENSGDSGSLYTAFKVLHRQRDSLSSDSGLVSDRGTLKSVKGKSGTVKSYSPKFCPEDSEVESPQHYPPMRNQSHEPFIPEPDYDSSDEEEVETQTDKNTLVTFGKAESAAEQLSTNMGNSTPTDGQPLRVRFSQTEAKRAIQEVKHRLTPKDEKLSSEENEVQRTETSDANSSNSPSESPVSQSVPEAPTEPPTPPPLPPTTLLPVTSPKKDETLPESTEKQTVVNGDLKLPEEKGPLSPVVDVASNSVKENISVFERRLEIASRVVPQAIQKKNNGVKVALSGSQTKTNDMRMHMKTSKSCPKDFIQDDCEKAENSSSGVSSDIEPTNPEDPGGSMPTSATLSKASVLLRQRAGARKGSLPEAGVLVMLKDTMIQRKKQVEVELANKRAYTKHAVSLSHLPPPAESGESSAECDSPKVKKPIERRQSQPAELIANVQAAIQRKHAEKQAEEKRSAAALAKSIENSLEMIRVEVDSLGLAAVNEVDVFTELLPPPPEFAISAAEHNNIASRGGATSGQSTAEAIAPPPEFSDTSPLGMQNYLMRTAASVGTTGRNGKYKYVDYSYRTLQPTSRAKIEHRVGTVPRGVGRPVIESASVALGTNPREGAKLLKGVHKEFRHKLLHEWSGKDVLDWLESLFLTEYKTRFSEAGITGAKLANMDNNDLMGLGVKQVGHRINMEKSLKRYK